MADNTVMQSGRYKAYPDYKDSGISYLEYVPKDWIVVKFGYTNVKAELGGNYLAGEGEDGIVVMKMGNISRGFIDLSKLERIPLNERYDNKHLLAPGDFLFNTRNSMELVGKVATWKGELKEVIYNSNILRITFSKKFVDSSDFMSYLFNSDRVLSQLRLIAKGTTNVAAVYYKDLASLIVALPPLKEQSKIAKFLDYETAKIDTLIEKQQRLIELLTEKRQAVISHAVTKGLNPDVPMQDSGVEWLGEVPVHWEVKEIKFQLKSLNSRRIPINSQDRGDREGIYRYYGSSGVIDYIDDYIFDEPTVLVGEDGANLLSRSTPLAFSAHGKYWVNNHAHILEAKDGLADFWAEVIDIIDVTPIVTGSAQPKLTAEALSNLKIAFPPTVKERKEIESFIHSSKHKYGELIGYAKKAIQLMQERRTALISAAVTGKIDVRDWVKPE